jgi:hypothetical protein
VGPFTQLIRAIANYEMPLEVYWLITVGSLVALHKLDDAAQAARAIQGLDPKLRPVNKSALLWKCATQVAIGHAEYNRACKVMQPSTARPDVDADVRVSAAAACASSRDSAAKHGPQLGLGAKLGVQRMAFTAQELFVQGFSLPPSAMPPTLSTTPAARRCSKPSGRSAPTCYCSHSPLVLMRLGKSFAVLLSQEGARMGDQFGSFVYCLTVHPAYVEIM